METPIERTNGNEYHKPRLDKLVDALDCGGAKNEALFEAARRIDEVCSKHRSYIGTVPFGSQTKGYAVEGSDTDIAVIYEYDDRALERDFAKLETEFDDKGIEVNILAWPISNTPLPFRKGRNVDPGTALLEQPQAISSLSLLSGVGHGGRLKEYRDSVRRKMAEMGERGRDDFFSSVLERCMEGERHALPKLKARTPSFDEGAYLAAREELWRKRIKDLFFE